MESEANCPLLLLGGAFFLTQPHGLVGSRTGGHRHHSTHKRNSNAIGDKNGRTLVQKISDILASTKADMLADTGFEYVHRIGRLGSYFELRG
jgi:hypothetical protein